MSMINFGITKIILRESLQGNEHHKLALYQGKGMTFFQGGSRGVDLVLELRWGGIRGVDFWTQKLTNFDQNSNFSLF